MTVTRRARIAVHKFTSCDGCQLALLNLGETLIALQDWVDIIHFAEAGAYAPDADVDIAFVEGSISTPDEQKRIQTLRSSCRYLVSIGACATAGGIQSLRNLKEDNGWVGAVYAHPDYIDTLDKVTPIAGQVKVDLELWGCPVSSRQILAAIRSLLWGVQPQEDQDKVCLECKRRLQVCVMVARGLPCMGPVTRTGCGAICPRFGRDCYGCYGPAESSNTRALSRRFTGLGLAPDAVARRFHGITNAAPVFHDAGINAYLPEQKHERH